MDEETNYMSHDQTHIVATKSTTMEASSENEALERLEHAPPFWRPNNRRKRLSKQLSMCETPRDIAWDRRRRQIMRQERMKVRTESAEDLTDDDLNELKGCIELGFGFNEEDQDGQRQLCNTLPALDLYFAVNRQASPVLSPTLTNSSSRLSLGGGGDSGSTLGSRSSSFDSPPGGVSDSDSQWKICSPGDNPEQVKTKLRHWAQAVACSVMQSS